MDVALAPASTLDAGGLAALFTAVYEGYWHPIVLDAAALERMVATYDLDLEASVVACDADGDPLGLAMLGRRGAEAWLGGMGVLAAHRGRGLGEVLTRAVIDAALRSGCSRLRLEVLEQNAPALAIYRGLGFAQLRDVAVWSLAGPPSAEAATPLETADALEALARAGLDDPWQRSLETIERMREGGAPLRAYGLRGSVSICTVADGRASLLAVDARPGDVAGLLRAPFADGAETLLWLNGDVDGPVAEALVAYGAAQLGRQHELVLDLTGR